MTTEIFIGVAVVLITGVVATVARHITNPDRHPDKTDIVYKDVCEIKHKSIEDCFEGKIMALDEKFDNFRNDIKDNFKEIKDLIKSKK